MRQLLAPAMAVLLTGCGLMTDKANEPVAESKLPFPQSIYVYDFAVSPAEVPSGAVAKQLAGAVDDPNGNAKRVALEQKIADTLSGKLVSALQEAGLPAVRWAGTPPKNKDAYVLEGQFLTTDDGTGQKIIGLTLGGTKLRVLAQLYHLESGQKRLFRKVTIGNHGLAGELPAAKLSSAKAASSLGTAVGPVQDTNAKVRKGAEETAATIVRLMKPTMQEQGWF
jgi:hypothetical protein